MVLMYALYEHASGYALFLVKEFEEVRWDDSCFILHVLVLIRSLVVVALVCFLGTVLSSSLSTSLYLFVSRRNTNTDKNVNTNTKKKKG